MGIENPVHLLFIAAVALIVLGPKRLPELARAVGKAAREFRESMNDGESAHLGEGAGAKEPDDAAQSAPAAGSPDHRG
jgi:sec-independent protein translocase protein TatA